VASLTIADEVAVQAKASPDGSVVLVSVVGSETLVRLSADENAHTWSETSSLPLGPLGKAPVCTVLRDDGQQSLCVATTE
jgi:hypothetical protein